MELHVSAPGMQGTRRSTLRLAIILSILAPWAFAQYMFAPVAHAAAGGLDVKVYNTTVGPSGPPDVSALTPCATTSVTQLKFAHVYSPSPYGTAWQNGVAPLGTGSAPFSCSGTDYVVHAYGYLTVASSSADVYDGSTEAVTFSQRSDAGFYMTVTDPETGAVQTLSDWTSHTAPVTGYRPVTSANTFTLLTGYTYDIDVWEWNDTSLGELDLAWARAGNSTTTIPQSAFSLKSAGPRPLTSQRGLVTSVADDFLVFRNSPSTTLSVTGGDGTGAVTFDQVAGPCTVTADTPVATPPTATLTPSAPGICQFTVTKASDGVFASKTSMTYSYTIKKVQDALVVTDGTANATGAMTFGTPLTLSTTGGSGDGAVSYQQVSGPCTVTADGVVTATGAAPAAPSSPCVVTATKAAGVDANFSYDSSTSAEYSIYIAKAAQSSVSISAASASVQYVLPRGDVLAAVTTVTATGGSGTGDYTFAVTGPCLVKPAGVTNGSTNTSTANGEAVVVATGAGDCVVTAGRAIDGDYLAADTTTTTITITKGDQPDPVLLAVADDSLTYNASSEPTTVATASGGFGTGTLTIYTTSNSSVCDVGPSSIDATSGATVATVTAHSNGACDLVATRGGDANFVALDSSTVTVNTAKPIVATVDRASVSATYGDVVSVIPVSVTSGDGQAPYTFSASGLPSGLSINSSTGEVSGTANAAQVATNASITVTDSNGQSDTASISFAVSKADPNLTWSNRQTSAITFGDSVSTLLATATSGTPVFATSTSSVCSVNSSTGVITVLSAGTCDYSATLANSSNYTGSSITGSFDIQPDTPSAPRNVTASVDNRTITVDWTAPSYLGGSTIASYTARATAGGVTSTCTATGGASSCDILGLTNATTYSVTVTATTNAVGEFSGKTSSEAPRVSAYIPAAQVRVVAGSIPNRYDPNPPSSALNTLSSSQKNDLLSAGIVQAPDGAPLVTITANLHDAVFDIPISIDIPQTVDSGSEVRVRVIPPQDTPVGAVLRATLTVSDGSRVDFGSTTLSATDIASGLTLSSFAIVTTGNYRLDVTISEPATTAIRNAAGDVRDDISYRIAVVAGSGGVPNIAAAPVADPTPTETPTETPTPTPTETPTETPTPTPTESVDARGLVVVDPLAAPVAVAKTAVAAVTLVSAVSAAAGAAAAAGSAAGAGGASGGGASGGARSGGGSASGGSAGSSGGDSGGGDNSDAVAQIQTVDVEHEVYEDLSQNWGDALSIWSIAGLTALDRRSANLTIKTSRWSPLVSKLITDGAYTTAIAGLLSVALPIANVVMAILAIRANGSVLLPPPTPLLMAMIVIGVFDAGAGALGLGIFAIGMSAVGGLHSIADLRMMLGLVVAGFAPTLLASAFRGLRRNAAMTSVQWWERLSDLAIAPFIAGWATKGMIDALSPLAGVALPASDKSGAIGLAVAISVFIRILLEEFAAQYFPGRLNVIHPTEVPSPPLGQKIFALLVRAATFFFVAEAFVGYGWYLWVGTVLFILPNFVGLVSDRFPNSTALYQILPGGLPGMTVQLYLASAGLGVLTTILGETPDLAKYAFALLPIPSTILSIIANFGREPREGDTRWYQRDSMKWLYRIVGPVVLLYTIHLAGLI